MFSSIRTRAFRLLSLRRFVATEPLPVVETTPPTFYRRPLPQGLIAFSSPEGRRIFREALDSGGMENYFAISEQFHTQSEPAYCGLGTLTMCLNALNLDPRRQWRGPWRWFSEELLDCCVPLDVARKVGITLDEFLCLARCNGAYAEAYRATDTDISHFRRVVRQVTSKPGLAALVASYSRRAIGQTGEGHFSPVGGYHRGRDLVLIMDVARFKYPPHWVPLPLLWDAMYEIDTVSNRSRGFCVLTPGEAPALPILWRLVTDHISWKDLITLLSTTVPTSFAARATAVDSVESALRVMLELLPGDTLLSRWTCELGAAISTEHQALIDALRRDLRHTPIHAAVTRACPAIADKESAAMVMLIIPLSAFAGVPPPVLQQLQELRNEMTLSDNLQAEVAALRTQLNFVMECSGCGSPTCTQRTGPRHSVVTGTSTVPHRHAHSHCAGHHSHTHSCASSTSGCLENHPSGAVLSR